MNPNEFEKKRPAAYEMGLLTFERNVRAQRRTHPTDQPPIVNAIVQDRPAISQSCADKFIKTPAAQREAIRLLPRENMPHGGGVNNENRLKIPTNIVGVDPSSRLLVKGRPHIQKWMSAIVTLARQAPFAHLEAATHAVAQKITLFTGIKMEKCNNINTLPLTLTIFIANKQLWNMNN